LAILRCARKAALGGPHIHEVYIDECQDNNISDFALILEIFDCVDRVFLAGDIVQCIASGSSFRFQGTRRKLKRSCLSLTLRECLIVYLFNADMRSLMYK